ncbi:MAG: hypothetical protein PHU95_02770 [Candidatus Thermoplasmatota archaeon]|nr:hypothetical protein [Candidatus Thermoplasmatota archaeon]MDD5778355.1 hypothetical protein [Candidatus Thermoplasmatota archaeon]
MENILRQKELIQAGNWDCLIVLDACRYDFFERIYSDFLKGYLRKVITSGTSTPHWLRNTFKGRYWDDVVYISGNPFINSKSVNLVNFRGDKHFFKVVDAWDSCWDDDMKTTMPDKLASLTKRMRAKYPNKRIISHFMQPHYPYLGLGPVKGGISGIQHSASTEINEEGYSPKLKYFIRVLMEKVLGWEHAKKMEKALGFIKVAGDEEVFRVAERYNKTKLRKLYEDNLIRVLKEVRLIASVLPGKIVVTSDHGELLGEKDFIWGHPGKYNHPILKQVPWFELDDGGN